MSEDWSLSVECSFLLYKRMLSSKRPVSDPILVVVWLVVAVAGSWCGSSGPKLVYRSSESFSKFEVRIRLQVFIYEWSWSLSIECSFRFYNRMLNSKRPVSDPILVVVLSRSSSDRFMVWLKMSKNGLQELRIRP